MLVFDLAIPANEPPDDLLNRVLAFCCRLRFVCRWNMNELHLCSSPIPFGFAQRAVVLVGGTGEKRVPSHVNGASKGSQAATAMGDNTHDEVT
jgi:hypothetical protein